MVFAAATTGPNRRRARLAAVGLASLGAACVITHESGEPATAGPGMPVAAPVSIPLPDFAAGGGSRARAEFFNGILRRLQDAADEGDAALLGNLIESFERPDLPEAFMEHLDGYRAIARGIEFQVHVAQNAQLKLLSKDDEAVEKTPALGEPLLLELELPAMAAPLRLGAQGEPDSVGFSVAVTLDDEYVDGSRREFQSKEFLWLPRAFELVGERRLRLPVAINADVGDAVRRSVVVRVDLMPGYVVIEGMRAPIQRVTAGAMTCTQWPKGYEVLAARPLAGLKAALKDFSQKSYASAYLSAMLIPAPQRREATSLLIDQVRFGRADQAQVAMAALRHVAGVEIAVGDRDAWLLWWQTKR